MTNGGIVDLLLVGAGASGGTFAWSLSPGGISILRAGNRPPEPPGYLLEPFDHGPLEPVKKHEPVYGEV